MFSDANGLTRSELRVVLRQAGFRVSEVQLEQWHKKGLIQRPQLQSRGEGNGRGKESRYPLIALLEAVLVVHFRRQYRLRWLDHVGWFVWCYGFPGHTAQARVFLERLIRRDLRKAARGMGDFESEVPGNPIDRAEYAKVRGTMGALRRHLGREFMPSLVRFWAETDLGRTDWIDGAEPAEFAQLLGVADALGVKGAITPDAAKQTLTAIGTANWWKIMRGLAKGLDAESVLSALRRIDDQRLEQLRDELQTLLAAWAGPFGQDLPLAEPHWFLLYFSLRYASPFWSPVMEEGLKEMHRAGQAPPLPSPWIQLLQQLRAEAESGRDASRRKP